jgi:hypothetical protein
MAQPRSEAFAAATGSRHPARQDDPGPPQPLYHGLRGDRGKEQVRLAAPDVCIGATTVSDPFDESSVTPKITTVASDPQRLTSVNSFFGSTSCPYAFLVPASPPTASRLQSDLQYNCRHTEIVRRGQAQMLHMVGKSDFDP